MRRSRVQLGHGEILVPNLVIFLFLKEMLLNYLQFFTAISSVLILQTLKTYRGYQRQFDYDSTCALLKQVNPQHKTNAERERISGFNKINPSLYGSLTM